MRLILFGLLALPAVCVAQAATDLEILHGLTEPAAYVAERLSAAASTDSTGSVTLSVGTGRPHTLLVAGLDQPGYVVSAITDDGYLRLRRL